MDALADATPSVAIPVYGAAPTLVLEEKIQFPPNSDAVPKQAAGTLNAIANLLKTRLLMIEVEGHAGPKEKSATLALRRAKGVRALLVERGVSEDQLIAVDRGASPTPGRPALGDSAVRFRLVPSRKDAG
jgi:outer membrane protein OmpA-like peptidoglycan-associated protein